MEPDEWIDGMSDILHSCREVGDWRSLIDYVVFWLAQGRLSLAAAEEELLGYAE